MPWYNDAATYYRDVDADTALSQGDILVAPTSIILPDTADSDIMAPAEPGQERHVTLWHGEPQTLREAPSLSAKVSWGLAMVLPDSCTLEKEWNERVTDLTKRGAAQQEAQRIADADETLDPFVVIAPLLTYDTLAEPKHRATQTASRLGIFPVCQNDQFYVPHAYIDFAQLTTVDQRLLPVELRIAALADVSVGFLRHALASYFALRSKARLDQLMDAIGETIIDILPIESPRGKLRVSILLENGNRLVLEGNASPAPAQPVPERAPRRAR